MKCPKCGMPSEPCMNCAMSDKPSVDAYSAVSTWDKIVETLTPVFGGPAIQDPNPVYDHIRQLSKSKTVPIKDDSTLEVLKDLVEAYYRQKPLPPRAIIFRAKMSTAIKHLKANNVAMPVFDAWFNSVDMQKKED